MFKSPDEINKIKLAVARTVVNGLTKEAIKQYNIFAELKLPRSEYGGAMCLECGTVQLWHDVDNDEFQALVTDRIRDYSDIITLVDYSCLLAMFDGPALADLAGVAFAEMKQSEKLSKRWSLL